MDEETVREHAQAFSDALVAGDVGRAIEDFSQEVQHNLGEVLALFPLPATEAAVDSVEHTGAGYNVAIRLTGEAEEVVVETRWKDRDGRPTIIEASHLSRVIAEPEVTDDDGTDGTADEVADQPA